MENKILQSSNLTPGDKASWDYAQIWEKFPVPARPSKEELKFLRQELSNLTHDNLLILGSTIEYRSLCKFFGIRPWVADFERSHYEILTNYAKEKLENEHFLEIDWLKINDENKYDIILGHRAINVIGKEVLQQFFDRMYKALKPGGVFFCKNNILYDGEPDHFVERVDKWAFAKNRTHPLFSYIEVDLYFYTADKDGYVVYPKARKVVDQIFIDKRCSKEDYNLMKMLVSVSEARFRGLIREKEVQGIIDKVGFSPKEWIILDKDICQNMPILKLTK